MMMMMMIMSLLRLVWLQDTGSMGQWPCSRSLGGGTRERVRGRSMDKGGWEGRDWDEVKGKEKGGAAQHSNDLASGATGTQLTRKELTGARY